MKTNRLFAPKNLFCSVTGLLLVSVSTVLSVKAFDPDLEVLSDGLSLTGTGARTTGTVESYTIPYEDYPDTITISLQGGDGGRAKATAAIGEDKAAEGGGGLQTEATFDIHPTDDNALRPGGELRFVIGNKGEDIEKVDVTGAGGGGATGLLYLSPESGSDWVLLAVCGGGGGGVASTLAVSTFSRTGRNATDSTSGVDGDSGGGGGANGSGGGSHSDDGVFVTGGGGGYLGDGGGDSRGGDRATSDGASGGEGRSDGSDGGFGYGAGGGGGTWGTANVTGEKGGGGGGGGYSGGGAGGERRQGGGGGSYINSNYTDDYTQTTRASSKSNGNANISYTLNASNSMPGPTVTPIGDDPYILYDYETFFEDPGATAVDVYGNEATLTGGFDTVVPGRVGTYSVTYNAEDVFGTTGSGTREVQIIAATRPTFDIAGNVTRNEDSGSYTDSDFITNFDAGESDQSLEYYTVSNDNNSLFSAQPAIDNSGELTFTLNSEVNGSATVSIIAYDNLDDPNNGFSDTATFTITVNSVDDPPTGVSLSNNVVAEGETAIGTVSATDPFSGSITYSITGGNDSAFFSIVESTGVLTFSSETDFENPGDANAGNNYEVDVTATGSDGATEASFVITVTDVAGDPTDLSISDTEVVEGYTGTIATVSAIDPLGGGDLVFEVTGGADASFFGIEETASSNSESLVIFADFDYDNPGDADGNNDYEVTISVSNGEGTTSGTFIIYVTERNDAPTDLVLDNTEVTDGETYVGILTGVDPNEGDVLTYSVSGSADAEFFTVDENTGEVSFIAAPDFSNPQDNNLDNIYRVRFEVSDGELTYDELFMIEVVEYDNPPENLRIDGESVTSIDVSEDVAADTQLAMFMAMDPDMAGPVFFSLTDDSGGRFSIMNNNRLMRTSTGTLDYESEPTTTIELLATDNTGATATWTITINITDAVEPGIEEFRSTYGLSSDGSEDAADTSGNGIANILYYAFGLGDPSQTSIDSTRMLTIAMTDDAITLTYTQPSDNNTGITINITSSTDDLATWSAITPLETDDGSGDPYISNTTDLGDGYEQITITIPSISENGFYRVEVDTH